MIRLIEFNDDEFETLRDAFDDVGNDCPGVDWKKFRALGERLGFFELEQPLTEEELKRREELANNPLMKQWREMMQNTNKELAKKFIADIEFVKGTQWPAKIGSQLRIKLPNDYQVKK